MNTLLRILTASLASACLGLTACATTEDLQQHATSLDDRLSTLENSLNELKQAHQALNQKVDSNHAQFISSRFEGRLVKQIALTEDKLLFPHNSVDLMGQDVKALDNLISEIKDCAPSYHVEIQGHTDDSGNPEFNYLLGEGRAKAVQRYLHQHGGIPLYQISTISFGARMPAGAKEGDSESNRRVEVLIYR